MLTAFKDMATELMGSKKFFIFIATLISSGLALVHWNVDPAVIDHYLELAGALIVAQGVADHGKGAVVAQMKAAAKGLAVPPPAKPPVAPVVATLALFAGGFALVHSGCSTVTKDVKAGGSAFIDCSKADIQQVVDGSTGLTLLAAVVGDLAQQNYADLIDQLVAKFGDVAVGCAVRAVDVALTAAKGSAATTAEATPALAHADDVISKRGWRFSGDSK